MSPPELVKRTGIVREARTSTNRERPLHDGTAAQLLIACGRRVAGIAGASSSEPGCKTYALYGLYDERRT
jgi:hypothetical protein